VSTLDLSVVIPVYRSQETLRPLTQRLMKVLDAEGRTYEIIFVDDGSPDNSWEVLEALQVEHPQSIVAIQLMRNYGQHNALMCGFRRSRGQFVITMDDDLQNPPEEIPKLINAIISRKLDIVYGSYESTKKHSGWRNLGSTIIITFYNHVFQNNIRGSSFRIIRRELVDSIFPYNLNFTYIDGLLAWNTKRIGEVPVAHHARETGRSGYNPLKLLTLALNLFTNFSLLPLQLVSMTGFVFSICGFIAACVYAILYLTHRITVPGYASIIIAVLVMGGIQLLSLGVLGEYLGRLHLNVNRKPQYVERIVLSPATPDPKVDSTHQG